MSPFHWRDGWTFDRAPGGSVVLSVPGMESKYIPAGEWASIVAAMSADGETTETYYAALDRQLRTST